MGRLTRICGPADARSMEGDTPLACAAIRCVCVVGAAGLLRARETIQLSLGQHLIDVLQPTCRRTLAGGVEASKRLKIVCQIPEIARGDRAVEVQGRHDPYVSAPVRTSCAPSSLRMPVMVRLSAIDRVRSWPCQGYGATA